MLKEKTSHEMQNRVKTRNQTKHGSLLLYSNDVNGLHPVSLYITISNRIALLNLHAINSAFFRLIFHILFSLSSAYELIFAYRIHKHYKLDAIDHLISQRQQQIHLEKFKSILKWMGKYLSRYFFFVASYVWCAVSYCAVCVLAHTESIPVDSAQK